MSSKKANIYFEIINGKIIKTIRGKTTICKASRISSITDIVSFTEIPKNMTMVHPTGHDMIKYNTIILYRGNEEVMCFVYHEKGRHDYERDLKILEDLFFQ